MACCSQITEQDGAFNRVVVCDSIFSPTQSTRTLIVDQARVGTLVTAARDVLPCAAEISAASGLFNGSIEVERMGNLVSLNLSADTSAISPTRGLLLANILDAECFPPQLVRTNFYVTPIGVPGGLGVLGINVVNIHPDGRIEIDPETLTFALPGGILTVNKMWFNI